MVLQSPSNRFKSINYINTGLLLSEYIEHLVCPCVFVNVIHKFQDLGTNDRFLGRRRDEIDDMRVLFKERFEVCRRFGSEGAELPEVCPLIGSGYYYRHDIV